MDEIASAVGGAMAIRADNRDAVDPFAGDDYEAAIVPAPARVLLSRFELRSVYYDVRFVHS